jgi:hypothetical protein
MGERGSGWKKEQGGRRKCSGTKEEERSLQACYGKGVITRVTKI